MERLGVHTAVNAAITGLVVLPALKPRERIPTVTKAELGTPSRPREQSASLNVRVLTVKKKTTTVEVARP